MEKNDLDLHGVRHADVELSVLNHIGKHNPPYDIITGNSQAMRDIVTTILKSSKLKYVIWASNPGSIRVLDSDMDALVINQNTFKDLNSKMVVDIQYKRKWRKK